MIRRFGQPPKIDKTYTLRPGVYAILRRGPNLLLTFQKKPDAEFQLPGGGIDPGESPLTTLHREVYEETGWTIARPRRIGAFRRFVYMPEYDLWAEKLCTIYTADPCLRRGPPTEPLHSAHWVPIKAATQILGNSGDRYFAGLLAR
ncbi:MAG: NUDIX hydrolase [Rhodobacteraceae bacterium]|nr:NUDIX hydrolase [Paracoccaceae bacterium]